MVCGKQASKNTDGGFERVEVVASVKSELMSYPFTRSSVFLCEVHDLECVDNVHNKVADSSIVGEVGALLG